MYATIIFRHDGSISLSRADGANDLKSLKTVLGRTTGLLSLVELGRLDGAGFELFIDRQVDLDRAKELKVLDTIRCATCARRLGRRTGAERCGCEG